MVCILIFVCDPVENATLHTSFVQLVVPLCWDVNFHILKSSPSETGLPSKEGSLIPDGNLAA